MLARGLVRRCPRCGGGNLFPRYWTLREACPTCGMKYERDPGYWLGAMIINTAVTIASFLIVFVGATIATWPDPPWTALLIGTMVLNLVVPVIVYPFSKTVFVALDLGVRPLSEEELAAAEVRTT